MVDIMDVYKSLNNSIETVIKNWNSNEMLNFVPDHLKTQKVCKDSIKKLLYLLRYVPELENGGTLKCVPDCCKKQEMCNKAVDNYPHVLEFVPECYKTPKNA